MGGLFHRIGKLGGQAMRPIDAGGGEFDDGQRADNLHWHPLLRTKGEML